MRTEVFDSRVLEAPRTHRWRRTRTSSSVDSAPSQPVFRRSRAVVTALGVVALALVSAGAKQAGGRVPQGPCTTVRECEAVATATEAALTECWWLCGEETSNHHEARVALVRERERRAERAHYEARNRADREESRERELRLQRDKASKARDAAQLAEREHAQRMELEALREDRADRRRQELHRREIRYLRALGPEGRQVRLRRCHRYEIHCGQLVLRLVEATRDPSEKTSLALLNERLLGGPQPFHEESLEIAEGQGSTLPQVSEPTETESPH